MQNNKGFSFIEMIVVVAIMAVLVSGIVVGIGSLAGWRVTDCASDIDSAMKNTKINAMSKFSAYMKIYCDSDGNYFLKESGKQAEKIASGGISIKYKNHNGVITDITEGSPLILSYNRSSGAFMSVITSVAEDGTFTFLTGEEGSYLYCSQIIITNERKTKVITLVKDTGKHTLE